MTGSGSPKVTQPFSLDPVHPIRIQANLARSGAHGTPLIWRLGYKLKNWVTLGNPNSCKTAVWRLEISVYSLLSSISKWQLYIRRNISKGARKGHRASLSLSASRSWAHSTFLTERTRVMFFTGAWWVLPIMCPTICQMRERERVCLCERLRARWSRTLLKSTPGSLNAV